MPSIGKHWKEVVGGFEYRHEWKLVSHSLDVVELVC